MDSKPDFSKTYLSEPPFQYKYNAQTTWNILANPNYKKEHQDTIQELEKHISKDSSDRYASKLLEENHVPAAAETDLNSFDPAEPRGLTNEVYHRIEELKILLDQGVVDDEDEKNIRAILVSYREGNLHVEPRKVSLWKGGKMKRGLGEDVDPKDFVNLVKKWNKEDSEGTPWVEDPEPADEMAEHAKYPPCNTHHQHKTFHYLDDTGAAYLSVRDTDLGRLGYCNNYAYKKGWRRMRTANGVVNKQKLGIEVRLLMLSGNYIQGFQETDAVAHRGPTYGSYLSGLFVRKSLFTGTCPDGNGNLVVSVKKHGITANIDVV
ncbi:hypothetical protein AJ80_01295 [Polytolypa hystricis UAMH7299]|uniref:Uncharacterized protein n=1 Tax=Polytolypa hystricis (strain UAMH7299) TaxID=1447883 RepID=A0A2B7Z1V5_POLH7|nr:hypothetical protein AJ80_01295 [Polytolypa hystricis UAMH7299]